MASASVNHLVGKILPYLPEDKREQLGATLAYGLDVVEKHGDPEGFAKLTRDVEAAVQALSEGNAGVALGILEEWGVLAYLPVGVVPGD